jgi:hypothetical protein
MTAHSHDFVEHHYVLDGEYESHRRSYPAGTYRVIPKGLEHGPFRCEHGATVFVMWEH